MSDIDINTGPERLGSLQAEEIPKGAERRRSTVWRRRTVDAVLAFSDAATAMGTTACLMILDIWAGRPVAAPNAAQLLLPAALFICLNLAFGLYRNSRSGPVELFQMRVTATLVFVAFMVAMFEQHFGPGFQFAIWVALAPVAVVLAIAMNGIARSLLGRLDLWRTRVVLVGDPAQTRNLEASLGDRSGSSVHVLARVDGSDPRFAVSARFAIEDADLAILVSTGDGQADARIAAMLDCRSVLVTRQAGDMRTLGLTARAFGDVVGIEIRRSRWARNRYLKRVFDFCLGFALLLAALPVVAVLASAIWCTDRRNPFYCQPRVGLNGRIIRVWKLRSMFSDAEIRLKAHLAVDIGALEEWSRCFKLRRDPRILPGIGAIIRRSSLDELPQLWNVVRGDMSLVGPRPFPAYHLASFDEAFRSLRCSVMPGLTGLWQITSRSDGDLAVQQSADTFYVRNRSVWFDMYILLHTLPAVVFGKGAR